MGRQHVWILVLVLAQACDCGGNPFSRPCDTEADCAEDETCVDNVCALPQSTECGGACTASEVCIDDVCVEQPDGCIDLDGDGSGEMCLRPDCDDNDPIQTGVERCDGRDNDCDGVVDNGVLSACGDCDAQCQTGGGIGAGGEMPFMPSDENADGVGLNPEGGLVLDSTQISSDYIWIANTGQGTVSRFNTETYVEQGRYQVGPDASSADPSRTSVNSLGDVYVGNRRGNRISRISVLGENCPDTNGDGQITTSSDANFLPWGQDDCVLWSTDMEPFFPGERTVRAVAAQDVEGPDGELIPYVWVGAHRLRKIAKLDGRTGEVLFVTDAPVPTYGFALDGLGNLWISGGSIGRVDTKRCLDEVSCNVQPRMGETPEADGAIKQILSPPHPPYGITVDFNQRVWIGGSGISSYTQTAAAGQRWSSSTLGGRTFVHGIAADAKGFVWGATTGAVVRVEAATMQALSVPGTPGSNKGMAVDSDGKIWSIIRGNTATVITPGPTINDNAVEVSAVSTLVSTYTYSDMTGAQLRLATNPRGFYRQIFEGCDAEVGTSWKALSFDAELPAGTSVVFRARTADTRAGLETAEWVSLGVAPPETSPLSILDAFDAANEEPKQFLMIEVGLRTERSDSSTEVVTPTVRAIDVSYVCDVFLG